MASTDSSQEQWPASKVRETFLEYFKEHGHTFGRTYTVESGHTVDTEADDSTIVVCGPTCGPDTSLRQCGHEPVQVDILRDR